MYVNTNIPSNLSLPPPYGFCPGYGPGVHLRSF